MPLSATRLGSEIKSALEAFFGTPEDDTKLSNVCNAIASAIVSEIQSNAQVMGTVESGQGAGGAITGTVE
jgi:hypothetical protein